MEIKRVAAIDIGSNAVRMLISNVLIDGTSHSYKKGNLVRLPIRLGADVFSEGKISKLNGNKLVSGMMAFKRIMEIHDVVTYKACATSAMREAENGEKWVQKVLKKSGIPIQIINGKEEARIIYSTQIAEMLDDTEPHLYVDVGGGSTEITLFYEGKILASQSFNIGTVRILNGKVSEEAWENLKTWLKRISNQFDFINLIGSGGNINKIFKISGIKNGKPLPYVKLYEIYKGLNKLSLDQRMSDMSLNPDRADVIVPAAEIFLTVMKTVSSKNVLVPKVGLPDGLARMAYEDFVEYKLDL